MSLMLDWALAATVLLGIALLLDRLNRRTAAATRHARVLMACALVMVWPLLRISAPEWKAPRATQAWWPEAAMAPATMTQDQRAAVAMPEAWAPSPLGEANDPSQFPGVSIPLLLWVATSSLLLFTMARRYLAASRLASSAPSITDLEWLADGDRVSRQLGLRRLPRLAASTDVVSPVAWGFGAGTIVVPHGLLETPSATRRAILCHEMAHLARRDHLSQLLVGVITAIHWYHPLCWVARGVLRRHAEVACDDQVVLGGARATWYAEELLQLALRTRAPATIPLAGLFGSGDLEHRVSSLTDAAQARTGPSHRRMLAITAPIVVLVTLTSGMRAPAFPEDRSGPPPGVARFHTPPAPILDPLSHGVPSRNQRQREPEHAPATWRQVGGPCPRFIGRRDLVRHCVHREIELWGASFTLDGGQNGDVTITGTDTDRIRVRAILDVQAADTVLAQALADRITIQAGGGVRPTIPSLGTQEWVGIAFVVELPRDLPVSITTWNGAVHLRQLAGPIDVSTLNGLIDIAKVSGRVRADGNNARYRVTLDGAFRTPAHELGSHNGNIELLVGQLDGVAFDLTTVNGRLTLDGIDPRSIGCEPAAGGCAGGRLSHNPAGQPALEARTTHGDITLRAIPPGGIN